MALSIFIDALPYNEVVANYQSYFPDAQLSELLPNIAYSSSLHWQLYCNQYPDERGVLVDWVKERESKRSVQILATLLAPFDRYSNFGLLARKVLDRVIYRKHTFANIPFRFRKLFSQKGCYLFWNERTYRAAPIFDSYTVISQDEGHKTLDATLDLLHAAIDRGDRNIFAVFGFADAEGHRCRRGELYSQRLKPGMDALLAAVRAYAEKNPQEEILLLSDHGMSTVERKVDLELEKHFGRQKNSTYIAYMDTAVMCIWSKNEALTAEIASYLQTRQEGHLLTPEDRKFFGATNPKFGDLIYILREGNVFANNWFGKSIKKPRPEGSGMHGFWPEREAKDQMACIWLINGKRKLLPESNYPYAHQIITEVMKGM